MQAAPGVYVIGAVASRAYLLGGVELTLIDAGGPGSAGRVLRAMARLEHRPQDLTRILLTHVDLDHVGGLGPLVEASGARVYAHPAAFERLAEGRVPRGDRGLSSAWALLRGLFVLPRRIEMQGEPLDDGAALPVLGGLRVVYTAGHSPDHVVYSLEQPRLIFAGDLLEARRGHLEACPGPGAAARQETVLALRRLASLDPLGILPGHGPAYRDNIALRLVRLAEILEE
ncbi:MAG TPA: MBL fold metallo-hydrolase [Anaerolineae bacterium]|nr:MBL fold metallo-hydrolase [Anaerolineae bacterium]HOQ98929.1 MBL fold metallo-hydrolase [Anaerolineae bacterium]HPL26525.1 MBL fold metallo-hydrolase [Anaerolineae bacterium]